MLGTFSVLDHIKQLFQQFPENCTKTKTISGNATSYESLPLSGFKKIKLLHPKFLKTSFWQKKKRLAPNFLRYRFFENRAWMKILKGFKLKKKIPKSLDKKLKAKKCFQIRNRFISGFIQFLKKLSD